MIKEYTEEDIDRIFYSGTTKEKATLFLRDRMGYFKYGIPFLLNFGEPETLMDSISPYDLKEWNKYISMGLRIENGFKDLSRFLIILISYRDDLSRILSELSDLEGVEEIVNESLFHCSMNNPLDPNEKGDEELIKHLRRISLSLGLRNSYLNKVRPVITPEGLFDFFPRQENLSLFEEDKKRTEFRDLRERAMSAYLNYKEWVSNYLCFEEALKRRINSVKLKLPEYEKLLTNLRGGLDIRQEPRSLRYEGFQDVRLMMFGEGSRSETMFPYPAMIDLIEDLSVRIEDVDLNTEENEKKIKEYFDSI